MSGIFTPALIPLMVVGGVWSTLVNLPLFIYQLNNGVALDLTPEQALGATLNVPSHLRQQVAQSGHPTELGRLIRIVYVPGVAEAFGSYALLAEDWLFVVAAFTRVRGPS